MVEETHRTVTPKWWLAGLLIAAFVIRIIAVMVVTGLTTPPDSGSDEQEYDVIAWNLAQGNGYRGLSPDVSDPNHVTAYRTPTTPLFYAGLYALFGHSYIPLHVSNAALAALTVWLIYSLTRRYAGVRAGLVAAALYAFYPAGIYYNLAILSEIHGAFLAALFAWCCLGIKDASGIGWSLAAGIVLGLLLLCKPGYVFLFPIFPVLGWFVFRWDARFWGRAVLLVGATALVLVPWVVRNQMVMRAFIPFGTGGGQLLLCGNNRIVVEDPRLFGYSVMDKSLPEYAAALADPNDEVRRDAVAKRLAVTWLRENPDKWFYLLQGKFRRLWTPFYLGRGRQTAGAVNSLYFGSVLVLFLLGLVPVTSKLIHERHPALIMHALIVATIVMALVFHGQHRYRFPIDSFCMSIVAVTLTHLVSGINNGSWREFRTRLLAGMSRHRSWLGAIGATSVALGFLWYTDQTHIELYRRETCQNKVTAIAEAIGRYKVRYDRLPEQLPDLIPEFLPNLDSLHCPSHSIGWTEYELLKESDVRGREFVVSYDLIATGSEGSVIVTESQPRHGGAANHVQVFQK
jgi:4-amino-4-deoxy-L-arabinose transferase-like glycosyltransferase